MATFRFWFKQLQGGIEIKKPVYREVTYSDLTWREMGVARERAIAELLELVPEDLRAQTQFEMVKEGK